MKIASLSPLLTLTAALVALGGASCADETIILATIHETDAGSPAPTTRCLSSLDCPADSYCNKASCSAPAGTCAIAQTGCQDESPVCGCDFVTYFNDCLRQSNRIESFTAGECQRSGVRCGGPANTPCPAGATCFARQLFHGPCQRDLFGSCWALPAECPAASGPERWNDCADDPALQCADTCKAIRSGATFRPAPQCP